MTNSNSWNQLLVGWKLKALHLGLPEVLLAVLAVPSWIPAPFRCCVWVEGRPWPELKAHRNPTATWPVLRVVEGYSFNAIKRRHRRQTRRQDWTKSGGQKVGTWWVRQFELQVRVELNQWIVLDLRAGSSSLRYASVPKARLGMAKLLHMDGRPFWNQGGEKWAYSRHQTKPRVLGGLHTTLMMNIDSLAI